MRSALERCIDIMSDPEARKVSTRALNTLKESCAENEDAVFQKQYSEFNYPNQYNSYQIMCDDKYLEIQSILTTTLCNSHCFNKDTWNNILATYNSDTVKSPQILMRLFNMFINSQKILTLSKKTSEDTEEGKDLYKGEFSLAYGDSHY